MSWLVYAEGKKNVLKDGQTTTEFGKLDVTNAKNGALVETSKGKKVRLVKPSFIDEYRWMKRGPQPITLKDCGSILSETLVGKESIVFDCGSGMGGLTCFLARYVKKVYSCDYRKDHLDITEENAKRLGLKNITFIERDIYEDMPKIPQVDLVSLDLQRPQDVIARVIPSLKFGAFVVAYCPQVTQMHSFFLKATEEGLQFVKAIDVTVREWKMDSKVCRPENMGLMHTGYLTFFRKV